ncbi:MAG: periplasmic heavy metal sensor [Alphaproteobacteria bacterium]
MTTTAVARPGRRTRVFLAVSLALNLFLAGMMIAWHMRPPPPGPWFERMIQRMSADLPPADREILRASYQARQGELDRMDKEARAAREKVSAAMRAQPYDPAALDQAMAAAREVREPVVKTVEQAVAEAAAKMSPEGRMKLADWRKGR